MVTKYETPLLLTDEFLRLLNDNKAFAAAVESWGRMNNQENGSLEILAALRSRQGFVRIHRSGTGQIVASHYHYDMQIHEDADSIAHGFGPKEFLNNLAGRSTAFTLSHAILSLPTYFDLITVTSNTTEGHDHEQFSEQPEPQVEFAPMYIQDAKRQLDLFERAVQGQQPDEVDEMYLEHLAEAARYLQDAVKWSSVMIALAKGADEDAIESVAHAIGENPLDLELSVRSFQVSALHKRAS